ncbi:MAG TPA: hypothetical protein VHG72_20705, partial [Polyangia bacterium]|nr:hypothetical protein [Polyangia bacterium]
MTQHSTWGRAARYLTFGAGLLAPVAFSCSSAPSSGARTGAGGAVSGGSPGGSAGSNAAGGT